MLRVATLILVVVGLFLHCFLLMGQNDLPTPQAIHAGPNLLVGSGESTTRTLELEGKITSVEGEPLAGATVGWPPSLRPRSI